MTAAKKVLDKITSYSSVVIFIAISSFIQYGFKMSSAYYTECI